MRFSINAEVSWLILPNSVKALLCIWASIGAVPDIIYTAGSQVLGLQEWIIVSSTFGRISQVHQDAFHGEEPLPFCR